jgi:hypothetical protein
MSRDRGDHAPIRKQSLTLGFLSESERRRSEGESKDPEGASFTMLHQGILFKNVVLPFRFRRSRAMSAISAIPSPLPLVN